MISNSFFSFLGQLSINNNRDWFLANKSAFEKDVKQPFHDLVHEICDILKTEIVGFNADPSNSVFRIYRDTRFSKDKTPYKLHMAAALNLNSAKSPSKPGFYLHLGMDTCEVGGGLHSPEKVDLMLLRNSIFKNYKQWNDIVSSKKFISELGGILGDRNKVLQEPYKSGLATKPDLSLKQFYFMKPIEQNNVIDNKKLAHDIVELYRQGYPLVDFLQNAIDGK